MTTIAQARRLLDIAKSDLVAKRISAQEYLVKRTALHETIVTLCAQTNTPLCAHGRTISCAQCALNGGQCRGNRGNFGFMA